MSDWTRRNREFDTYSTGSFLNTLINKTSRSFEVLFEDSGMIMKKSHTVQRKEKDRNSENCWPAIIHLKTKKDHEQWPQ